MPYSSLPRITALLCMIGLLGACAEVPSTSKRQALECFILESRNIDELGETLEAELIISNVSRRPIIFQNDGNASDIAKIWLSINDNEHSISNPSSALMFPDNAEAQKRLILPAYSSTQLSVSQAIDDDDQGKKGVEIEQISLNMRTDTHGFIYCDIPLRPKLKRSR